MQMPRSKTPAFPGFCFVCLVCQAEGKNRNFNKVKKVKIKIIIFFLSFSVFTGPLARSYIIMPREVNQEY